MLECEKCLKSDVCGKRHEAKRLLEKLGLYYEFQELQNMNIKIDVNCGNYVSAPAKILRGEE